MKRWPLLFIALVFLLTLSACGGDTTNTSNSEPPTETDGATEAEDEKMDEGQEDPPNGEEAEDNQDEGSSEDLMMATVEMLNTDGDAAGTVALTTESDGVGLALNLENLESGVHGIQFHDAGKCEVPSFDSAGEPFAGGVQTFEVGDDGTAKDEFVVKGVSLKTDDENSLLKEGGTALLIYAEEDEGERIACGIVTGETQ
ncbi:superoxide dismutase family protein [Planococcus sp. N028]|uniref:Superoxide dismutase family protein n=1 Tax=Planococcus shixiaomingii TaxID=3058393 RepID=A0ABT8N377_9BACL|nr:MULTISPECIES: superoxide dismutase family protein [unclassified Planococcus (in: firmicutes)]MDN7242000.1 superoxide dismutase family protein [Planococcus sp. N028]WKA54280.1 superoxide dismutase family protein [Planococcus sp. N022]